MGNYLVYGEYPESDGPEAALYLPSGVLWGRELGDVECFDPRKITEFITHSWFNYSAGDDQGLHPSEGETQPHYTGPAPPPPSLRSAGWRRGESRA